MLLSLFVFVFLLISADSAVFNHSEVTRNQRGMLDYFGGDSSPFLVNYNPFKPYWFNRPYIVDNAADVEGRSRLWSRFRPSNKNGVSSNEDDAGPASRIINRLSSFTGNSDGNYLLSGLRNFNPLMTFQSCESANGEELGICLPSPVCSFYGGRPTGGPSCRLGSTCCINEVTKCGALVTLNNTYWQSPASVSSESTCGLTVKIDQYLIEQKKPVCQIRLDFIAFSIAQPNAETVCKVDTFQVAGATNKVPIICGDNDGQHMYLTLPRDATSAQLVMAFGTSTTARAWRIKIGLLPCGVNYLAPDECLQYFTTAVGSVLTFNWKDTTSRTTRQLANQDYYICFRTELVNKQSSSQVATMLCLSNCQVSNGLPFSLSGAVDATPQGAATSSCSSDYVIFAGGYSLPPTTPFNLRDRFCGTLWAQTTAPAVGDPAAVTQTICSTVKPFRLLYRTNGDETITATADTDPNRGNQGFCLAFEQRLS